jgi:anti-sigma B factor antagonist
MGRPPTREDSGGASIRRADHGPGTVVVSVAGELDLAAAPALKWALTDEVRAGAAHIVLDLAETSFMDSTAISVLVGIDRILEPGRRLSLVALQPEVLLTFQLTGLDRTFPPFASVEDALADCARPDDQAQSS